MADFNDEEYDDDDDNDEGIPEGDVINMDDNNIDIAASMIDALSLPKLAKDLGVAISLMTRWEEDIDSTQTKFKLALPEVCFKGS